tara:strand:- start:2887 stop:3369 length:483 start_codon:yes stop_codon:yes gene_type:complete
VQDAGGLAPLHDPSVLHDHHPIAQVLHDSDVVGDHDDRHPLVLSESVEQTKDLGSHRDIERRQRLVTDEQAGAVHDRSRESDSLTLTPRELAREPVGRRGIQTYLCEDLPHPRSPVPGDAKRPQRFADDAPHAHTRIERGVGVLKDDAGLPTKPPQRSRR